ncbi:50S ribosomal protein L18 [Candidatus Gottesmanbacteria bacterium RIFCSPLOWO2_01_FULL_48_11]|uniref:Large ribosomal subunit protein uL18 n=3 Tax=Candidatus Gottesmaniibacteriota TaxID=1752720 RepID=A0A0G1XNJ7_9BACT|nr:MAG: 50S ribosomal protein L18 [Candidatus Gottesmanbacteria bacterium GW2011_GWA2_47_9]KKU95910.1 MAG: 50S ribosomal protein L18 [Candidatus Gottesmanbacteria bacterium GW2011_GWA1_48_13]OGG26607.1 MAG: 50S ribosomal protein L18 [Candidatus Gottesmanbacteria bacterium RIFCSPLOWO2_01_FULL_48_11]
MNQKKELRLRRRRRIRSEIAGTPRRPRLAVFRSNAGLYVQLIDDTKGMTIASVRAKGNNRAVALALGREIAQKAKEKKITSVVFDRGGFRYGQVLKTLADTARGCGLTF